MSEPLTIIISSRGRLESLRRCVNSAIAYADRRPNIEIYFDDDQECFEAYTCPPNVVKDDIMERAYYVAIMNHAFDNLASDVDYFIICNNDQEFIEPGWDIIAMDKLYEKWPDGMGVLEIGNHEDLSYNTFLSRTSFWVEHYDGKLFNPDFIQYYADTDRCASLNTTGHLARLGPGLVNTHSAWDEVKHSGRQWMARDKAIWNDMENARLAEKCL